MPILSLPNPQPTSSSLRKKLSVRALSVKFRHKFRRPRAQQPSEPEIVRLPHIPPELWGLIIQHACLFHHDPLDTSQDLSFLESPSTQLATYRSCMATKRNLSLVSSQWNALTRSFLFEFVWISRAAQAKALARTLLMEYVENFSSSGKFIRRLHIETPALERCAPADLRTILDYSPHLAIYSDHHSVQRNVLEDSPDPRCSPEEILKLVAQPKIRRLSWTSYDDVPFELRMAPLVKNVTTRLEYLELSSRCTDLSGFNNALTASSTTGNFGHLQMNVHLPSLRALKVSLDNNTFAVLASWDMPALTNLSVMSSDFSYTGEGFSRFFQAHGRKLMQLELGHSSSLIEEYYLTTPQHLVALQQQNQNQPAHSPPVPLAEWCPNLREFICSADAEWHWQSPDWIAPHILLPAHPRVELIGIRDIDTRLLEDPISSRLDTDSTSSTILSYDSLDVNDADTPYFLLYEQISSLLSRDAFPSLRFVRDLSAESHRMRTVRPSARVLQFWKKVVARCAERAVWFEDCTGVNVTQGALRRATLNVGGEMGAA
ncbi:hypothetical protein DICSQDRAFT_161078 [Dichomitus squalens LYAD-421 SS1]|uniref:Uncharacterized protein n=2 Tax=Dichomitus squalens TaxID=114155 RepID=A0A4Q9PVM9_9APHY|nr:uncharacterized protein DICSQDRAFT_161078 [Dichomitus squalens LYAD-421 SS1]EJF62186.1 hypothetical protein DICSQDRAFT_161078 [Dichomitus squalens LYAD-421 SS1]TBU28688.1 hypothetical protein BD311DRAFT_721855 [Dichomitus squalens]TBU58692.1 hypothetical protein BD310DRAFT_977230 [Dichomitus squalens]